jgi:1-acyl-sn-glycerol-3-phosphate acyltransferase
VLGVLAMGQAYLAYETAGILVSIWIWLSGFADSPQRWAERNGRLQDWWANSLMRAARRLLGFELAVEGLTALDGPAPLLFLRHASLLDTLLPATLIAVPRGVRLRYVLKSELLWDPCLDVNGNRLRNHFTLRGAGDGPTEIAAVTALLDEIGDEGIAICPEGTRFSEDKRRRTLERLREQGRDALAGLAAELHHTLPPRLGGPLALLQNNPGLDVVVCAHTGFEPTASPSQLFAGALRGATVRVGFWRIPFAELPKDVQEQRGWLFDQWRRVDRWIASHSPAAAARPERAADGG